MTLNKWQSLLAQTRVTGGESSICNDENFAVFERDVGLRFPLGYKEFCEVFGPGILGGFIQIDCPCFLGNPTDPGVASASLSGLKAQLLWEKERSASGEQADSAKLTFLDAVLSKAFVFGSNPNGHKILWDLASYQEPDKSCNIYLVPSDELEQTTLVGRDFYEFVRDFCLGSLAEKVLPERLNFSKEMTGRNFFRFNQAMLEQT